MGLMRMDADGEPDVGPHLLEAPSLRGFLVVAGRENHESPLQPGGSRASDDLLEVPREHVVCQVAVAVDENATSGTLHRRGFVGGAASCCSN
jgi:hypothetical protein